MKQYLKLKITSHTGKVWDNPLKMSEGHLIPLLAANNRSLTVMCAEASEAEYNRIFYNMSWENTQQAVLDSVLARVKANGYVQLQDNRRLMEYDININDHLKLHNEDFISFLDLGLIKYDDVKNFKL